MWFKSGPGSAGAEADARGSEEGCLISFSLLQTENEEARFFEDF